MTTLACIGGSGLYDLEELSDKEQHKVQTPFGAPSAPIVGGRLQQSTSSHDKGVQWLFLPRHGIGHHIPPHRINYRANIHALKQLGAEAVISISAVGSLRENMKPGDIVLCDQFIDRTHSRHSTFFDEGIVAHVSFADPVDKILQEKIAATCKQLNFTCHTKGTYVCIEGPQFSTRAESHLYRQWGADIIGMTNLTEAKLAREAELPYVSVCLVTDYDCWRSTSESVNVQEVLQTLKSNSAKGKSLVRQLSSWNFDSAASPTVTALQNAIISDLSLVDSKTLRQYELLIGKYIHKPTL